MKSVVVCCSGEGYDVVVVGWNCCLVEVDIVEVMIQFLVVVECFILLQEVYVVLGNKNVVWIQVMFIVFIKGGGKQVFVRVYWIGIVGNDYIKGLMGLIDEIYVVVDYQCKVWIVVVVGIVVG